MRIGIDTGGTFTDFVIVADDGSVTAHKVASTPAAPERAIIDGLAALGIDHRGARIVHGSTVATNAVLEGKGARTVFVTNYGFGDTLTIGRQARARLYDLQPPRVEPPVPRELCIETGGRVTPAGDTLEDLADDDVAALARRIADSGADSVAISLLFSFVDDRFERRIADALPSSLFVSCSSEVLREYREYERGIATWLNARVGPLMAGYLGRLRAALAGARLAVMQSSAGTVSAEHASRRAVHLLLSGPAGGVVGAAAVARAAGAQRVLTFDMGGTSTDVALIDGEPALTGDGRVGGYPVATPMVDVHTIGAGGGSIAWRDAGGVLRVGPQSAGADPGPACYGRGGTQPTVTDAHLLLGRLPDDGLAGGLVLDTRAAHAAFAPLAASLGLSVEDTARGVLAVADEHMVQALRVMSVARGHDPADFMLFAFGGAGGLHVCSLADKLGVARAMFPANAGVLSAYGMLVAPRARDLSRTRIAPLASVTAQEVASGFEALAAEGIAALLDEGVREAECTVDRTVELRYPGQSHALEVPWGADAADAFHAAHRARFGHALDMPVELVNLRVRVSAPAERVAAAPRAGDARTVVGPAIVATQDSTLWVAEGWTAEEDGSGNWRLGRGA